MSNYMDGFFRALAQPSSADHLYKAGTALQDWISDYRSHGGRQNNSRRDDTRGYRTQRDDALAMPANITVSYQDGVENVPPGTASQHSAEQDAKVREMLRQPWMKHEEEGAFSILEKPVLVPVQKQPQFPAEDERSMREIMRDISKYRPPGSGSPYSPSGEKAPEGYEYVHPSTLEMQKIFEEVNRQIMDWLDEGNPDPRLLRRKREKRSSNRSRESR